MKQYNLWIKTTLHCLHYSTGYLRSSKELFNKTKAKRNCSVPWGLYVSACVCVKSAAINCVCLLYRWRNSPLPCAALILCSNAALLFRGVFATCSPCFTPHTYTPYTSAGTCNLLSHLATSAQCGCVLCARVRFHLSAISNATSHPAQERGTAR